MNPLEDSTSTDTLVSAPIWSHLARQGSSELIFGFIFISVQPYINLSETVSPIQKGDAPTVSCLCTVTLN